MTVTIKQNVIQFTMYLFSVLLLSSNLISVLVSDNILAVHGGWHIAVAANLRMWFVIKTLTNCSSFRASFVSS